ncbi:MAG: DUF5684 domain-containing protein [Coriobacteriia bacterium]|nr:DUF5684 domain-containing protein [Coriobacteriia bacterium]
MNFNFDLNQFIAQLEGSPVTTLVAAFVILVVCIVLVVVAIAGTWKTVSKLGGRGWSQIIPVYSAWERSSAAGCERALCVAYTVLAGVAFVSSVVSNESLQSIAGLCDLAYLIIGVMVAYKIARRFGKGKGFTVGLVILPFIFYGILGLGSAQPVELKE